MKQTKGVLLLLTTALIWGSAFVAQTSAADHIGSFTFNTARSIIAAIFLLAMIGIQKLSPKKEGTAKSNVSPRRLMFGGSMCGIALFAAANLQQLGIAAYPEGTPAAGRAGFITATYVVMVALFSWVFGKRPHALVFAASAGCIAGMALLCLSDGFSGIYLGDILLLSCAVCFTAHIFTIDHFADVDGIRLSCVQFLVCAVLSAAAALIFEDFSFTDLKGAWLPIMYAGILSSGVGYTFQIIGQKFTDPAVASIIMSLESVFAALAGWLLLHEHLSPRELTGCVLVFVSVVLAQIPGFIKKT
ncbi:MAG: DMT family transporter [Clostridiales bacterium]|nr:DMT family transporter [Clostridiales bacterium]